MVVSLVYAQAGTQSGSLFFADQGNRECAWTGCPLDGDDNEIRSEFSAFIGRIAPSATLTGATVTTIVGAGGSAESRLTASEMGLSQTVSGTVFMPVAPSNAAVLADGSIVFNDGGLVMTAKASGASAFTVNRFYGGENRDCGFNPIPPDAPLPDGSVPTLGNALGRICSGSILDIKAYDNCASSAEGKAFIAVSQKLAAESAGAAGGGSVLRMEILCKSLSANLE
jgi:hypothetical protein